MDNIEMLIKRIRAEERKKILEDINSGKEGKYPWNVISDHIDDWGEDNFVYRWNLNKIKNSIYTIIRFSLDIDRMARLREEQLDLALDITEEILNMISLNNNEEDK